MPLRTAWCQPAQLALVALLSAMIWMSVNAKLWSPVEREEKVDVVQRGWVVALEGQTKGI